MAKSASTRETKSREAKSEDTAKARTAANAEAARGRTDEQKASDKVGNVVHDDRGLITPPIADPIALGTAVPIPPAVVAGPMPLQTNDEFVGGTAVPDPRTMSGTEQQRIEALTGKRLHAGLSTKVAGEKYAEDLRARGEALRDEVQEHEDEADEERKAAVDEAQKDADKRSHEHDEHGHDRKSKR